MNLKKYDDEGNDFLWNEKKIIVKFTHFIIHLCKICLNFMIRSLEKFISNL